MALALVGATVFPYLDGGFVWDDGPLIAERLARLDASGFVRLWIEPVSGDGPGSTYYRPVSMTVLALVGRLGPYAVHFGAAVLHLINASLLIRICANLRWPAVAGLVYGVHPIASEALGWASSLPDLLAVFLGLCAVTAGRRSVWLGAALVVLAGLSKETGLLIPLFVGVAGLSHERWRVSWAAGVGAVVSSRLILGVGTASGWLAKLELIPEALGWSLASLVWPLPLNAVRSIWVAPGWVLPVSGLLVAGLVVAARKDRAALAGVGLMVAAPVLALPVMLDGYLIAERYMTPALIGAGLFAGARVFPSPARTGVAIVVALISVGLHWQRAPAWQSDTALFSASVSATPNSSYAWHLYGVSLAEEGRFREAAAAFGIALKCTHPHPLDSMLQLRAFVQAGDSDIALDLAEAGAKEDLTAEYIAWWARAAHETGHIGRSKELVEMLKTEDGFDGPDWVGPWFERVAPTFQR